MLIKKFLFCFNRNTSKYIQLNHNKQNVIFSNTRGKPVAVWGGTLTYLLLSYWKGKKL
jgi:hypothetical protein